MSEHIEKHQLHELLKELAQKEYGDKYGEQIFWYFQDVIDDSCKLDVLEEENERLHSIIKEVREYIEEHKQKGYRTPMSDDYEFWNELDDKEIKELLEILDKESK